MRGMTLKLAPLLAFVGRPHGGDCEYHLFLPEQHKWLARTRKVR